MLYEIKNNLIKILLVFSFFISLFSIGNITYATDNTTQVNKEEIKFGKIFQLFINDPDVKKANGKKANIETCNYLNNNPIKKSSLKGFGNVLYFIIYNLVLIGSLITFFFYKIVDIYQDIRADKIIADGQEANVQKDIINVILDSIIKHGLSILAVIIFFIAMTYLIESLTLSCQN